MVLAAAEDVAAFLPVMNDVGLTGLLTVGIVLRLFSQTLVPLLTLVGAVVVAVTVTLTGGGATGALGAAGKLLRGNMLRISASGSLMRVEMSV